ncbi:MAG: hypothetical protein GX285_02540 [Clostridiales bacterium]|nr:hypothetical protein [Clostridiales bacterium]
MKRKGIIFAVALLLLLVFIFSSGIKTAANLLLANIQKQYFLLASKDMNTLETENFIIRYEDSTENANMTAAIAEKYYGLLSQEFDFHSEKKIPIIVYNDIQKMKKTAFMKTDGIPMGLYVGKTVQVLSPDIWIPSDKNKAQIYEKRGPIIHELTHYIVDEITGGNHDKWFFEGISLYMEYQYTGYVIGNKSKDKELYTLAELENSFSELNQIKAYYSSFMYIKSLVEEKDFEYLKNVLQYFKDNENTKIFI